MNERIRQLAEQARQEFLKLPTGYTPEQVGMYPQLMEKFAELIVQECISAVEDTNDRHRRDYFAAKIRQHFGIQE